MRFSMFSFACLLLAVPSSALDIVCGWEHNCVFERGQTGMKCWGMNRDGQVGVSDSNNRGDDANEMGTNLPFTHIGTDFIIDDVSLGRYHSCAMSEGRAMKCFGNNAYSQLGFVGVTATGDALPFVDVGAGIILSKIAAGYQHTCVLSTEAVLKCFGRNDAGQCGAGTTTSPISGPPPQINAIDLGTNFAATDVYTFQHNVCALSQQGTIKCFGEGRFYKLGYGDTTNRGSTPDSMGDGLPIVNLGAGFVPKLIAMGAYHSCALSTAKTVKCWGENSFGQCGTPHSSETGDNLPAIDLGTDFVPMQLALGSHHTCVLSETATMKCFGRNSRGQLGIGSTSNVDTPSTLMPIDLGSDFVPRQISAGALHTCAVSINDGVKCWGSNEFGQLGLGHMNNMGDEPNEMGDNLPFVDVDWPVPTTAAPTTATPTTKQPTANPSTASPTTASPSTPTTSEPTAGPTNAPTSLPSFSPSALPATASSATEPTNGPTTTDPTTAQPSTPSLATTPTATSVTVTIRTDSLSSTQILIAIANAYNLSSTPLTITTLSSNDDDDGGGGFATVELLVAVASDVELDYDVIEATLREAIVDEYGEDVQVDIDVHGDDDDDEGESFNFLDWRLTVALCIASVCFCFAVAGVIKCRLAKRRQMHIELPERPRPLPAAVVMSNAYGLHSESEAEEKKEDVHPDVNPGAGGEPDLELEQSVSNRGDEGRRASVAAQTAAVTAGMAADEFEVVDDHKTDAGHSANFVRAQPTPAGMEEDEFEVVDDDASNQVNTAGHTRSE